MPKLNNVDYFIQIGCQHMNMHYMDTNEYITMTMILSIIDQVCFDKCQKIRPPYPGGAYYANECWRQGHHCIFLQMNADASDQNTAQLSLSWPWLLAEIQWPPSKHHIQRFYCYAKDGPVRSRWSVASPVNHPLETSNKDTCLVLPCQALALSYIY